jgi:uncharacterized protein
VEKKITNLIAYCQGIYKKQNGKALYGTYLKQIESVTPQEVFLVMNEQLKMGLTPKDILSFLDKIIKTFQNSLEAYIWQKPQADSFIYYLIEENKALIEILQAFKTTIKSKDMTRIKRQAPDLLKEINKYNAHLIKLENILFPYMEQKKPRYDGLKIMWALHDDIRKQLKQTTLLFKDDHADESQINIQLGKLYFKLYGVVQKQELILFPAASELFLSDEFEKMHAQSFDYDFPLIDSPQKPTLRFESISESLDMDMRHILKTQTGNLSYAQIELLINTLPVDITFVDENDKVAFFSRPKERIFPRSAAVIGRDVKNCHPPDSVHVVEKIIASFKDGSKDHASFWIQHKGMFVLIQYFAMRDSNGDYKGTLEVSQEISEICSLEGEKRLLDE